MSGLAQGALRGLISSLMGMRPHPAHRCTVRTCLCAVGPGSTWLESQANQLYGSLLPVVWHNISQLAQVYGSHLPVVRLVSARPGVRFAPA